jgi:hypothetical protein
MSADTKAMMKALKLRFAAKAIHTFDRATMIVVGACWGAAILMVLFALYAVILSASTRRAAEAASASEPVLPKTIHKPIEPRETLPLVERLKHRFSSISITLNGDQSVTLTANDGSKFREWLMAMSYTDVMSPQYRWTIKEFCAGKCSGGVLMRAVLTGEKISFEAPEPGDKDSH